jgi:tetratricopeptide (TPR) repeat protein
LVRVRLLILIATLSAPTISFASQTAAEETLVMPFDSSQAEPRLYWLGEGSAVLLEDLLERLGSTVVPRDERLRAFERLQLPPAASLSHATMIKVAQFVGASDMVVGAYELAGDHVTVRARLIRIDAGRLLPEIIERGPLADLFAIFERAAIRVKGSGNSPVALPKGSLLAAPQAFELYVKGLIAETPTTQRAFLEQALAAAPGDDRVRLALWQVLTDLGDQLKALDVVLSVPATSRHARVARYLAALSQIELKRYDAAFDGLKALHSESRSAEVLNAIGVVQLRRGSTPQTGPATYYFSQASQLDPTEADYFFNLAYAYWVDKDHPAAMYWMREAVRRDPADGDAHYILGAALQESGAVAEASREKELAHRLSSAYASWEARGGDPVPRGRERLQDHFERPGSRVDSIITSTGQRDHDALATHHFDTGRRAFEREADREAEQELRRALYLAPYRAEAHLLLGRIHLRNSRASDAIQAFKIALWSEETVAAHIALAEAYLQVQDAALARAEIDRALVMDPSSAEAKSLRAKLP